MYSLAFRIMLP